MLARTRIGTRRSCVGPGNFAIAIRRKPYAAAFDTTPDRTAAISGDDSRYASGSQPWSGKSGALIANAATKPRKIHWLELVPILTKSNVFSDSPYTITAASISSDPVMV